QGPTGTFSGYEQTTSDLGGLLESGFYQDGGATVTGDVPDQAHGWTHLITGRHSNAGNNHQLQIAASYAVNDRLFFRKIAAGAAPDNPAWNEVATRGSNTFSGAQTVNGGAELYGGGAGLYLNQPSATDLYIRYHMPGVRWWTVGAKPNGDFWFSNASDLSAAGPLTLANSGNVGIGHSAPSYKLHVAGDIYANGGWFRVSGGQGIYWESYGGGWYMVDSDWIRSYGGKNIYHDSGIMRTDGTLQVGGGGTTMNVINGGTLQFRPNGGNSFIMDTRNGTQTLRPETAYNGWVGDWDFPFWVHSSQYSIRNIELGLSDSRVKRNIKASDRGLDAVMRLLPVRYDIDRDRHPLASTEREMYPHDQENFLGFLAQDLAEVLPEMVIHDEKRDLWMVRNWEQLSAVLVKAVQEQQTTIVSLRRQVAALQERLDAGGSSAAPSSRDRELDELQVRVLQLEGALSELLDR
ncbi:MAG: tail fiber domain-containing protein, partial [Deltaproteobacteria bacterium]|nr:tail fiber domain-containing protein [Deltaproteobacteria bacterium]